VDCTTAKLELLHNCERSETRQAVSHDDGRGHDDNDNDKVTSSEIKMNEK